MKLTTTILLSTLALVSLTPLTASAASCAAEEQAVVACQKKYPGSSCPRTRAKRDLCLNNSSPAQAPNATSDAVVSGCDGVQAEVAACKIKYPGSSCPRTTAKLNACILGNSEIAAPSSLIPPADVSNGVGPASGKCAAEVQAVADCKVQYPGSSCPRTSAKLEDCQGGGTDSTVFNTNDPNSRSCKLPEDPKKQNDFQCMLCNCYHEARGESAEGRLAVGKVVMTRLRTRRFPKTVCGVIYQEDQFTWAKKAPNMTEDTGYNRCKKSAQDALDYKGKFAVHYHTKKTSAGWTTYNGMKCPKLTTIDNHVFYKDCDAYFTMKAAAGGTSVGH